MISQLFVLFDFLIKLIIKENDQKMSKYHKGIYQVQGINIYRDGVRLDGGSFDKGIVKNIDVFDEGCIIIVYESPIYGWDTILTYFPDNGLYIKATYNYTRGAFIYSGLLHEWCHDFDDFYDEDLVVIFIHEIGCRICKQRCEILTWDLDQAMSRIYGSRYNRSDIIEPKRLYDITWPGISMKNRLNDIRIICSE